MTPRAFESAACEIAREAGELLAARFGVRDELRVESKGLHDYVTGVDREAEGRIVASLKGRFPEHSILAEEGAAYRGSSRYRWIVDPLDGTTNFIHGVPTFGVSIALEDEAGLVAGAICDPIRRETFHACRGEGAWLDGDPIRCSSPARLDEALIATGFPFRELARLGEYLGAFEAFVRVTSGLRRAGSAALDLAYTASGRYDGFWEIGLSPWDIAAGALLVREAGGFVTDTRGGGKFLEEGSVVAAGQTIHAAMIDITRRHLG